MRKMLLIGTLMTLSLGLMYGVAAAQSGDFATGAGDDGTGHFEFNAHETGASLDKGHMSYRSPTQVVTADVVCMNVVGERAFILGSIIGDKSSGTPAGFGLVVFEVRDTPVADEFAMFFASASFGCRLTPFGGAPIARGSIIVRDRTP